jgi:hypothetical protein
MQAKYPFLGLWKKNGLKKFPPIPYQTLVDHFIAGLLEPISKPTSTDKPYWDDDFEIRLRQKQDEMKSYLMGEYPLGWPKLQALIRGLNYEWKKTLAPMIKKFYLEETEKAISADYFEWGKLVSEARKKLLNGADREKILRELGHKVLPSKRGGASLLFGIQLRTLKNVYIEMQEAIKEARRTIDLNVNRPNPDEAQFLKWDDIIELWPEADTIFERAEVEEILSKRTPADAASNIIVRRLGRVLKTNIKSSRSLQNRLQNVKPIIRQD